MQSESYTIRLHTAFADFVYRKKNIRFGLWEKAELQPDKAGYIRDWYECDIKASLDARVATGFIGAFEQLYKVKYFGSRNLK